MNLPPRITVILISSVLSAGMIVGHARWLAPQTPRLAVLDVAELYRLKEIQTASQLTRRDISEEERAATLKRVQGFGSEVTRVIQSLPEECHCLILARGALVGPETELPDLTATVKQRLGL